MKEKIIVLVLSLFTCCALAQDIVLSDQAEISVITCGPGQEAVFTAFGHSAFRVVDPVNNIDAAFNYGVFDFNQPNFYLNFARGHNQYRLAVQDYKQFAYTYEYYNRYVHEQLLNLTPFQKQKVFDYLVWNSHPENQYYLYDYFYNNCATKLPEIILNIFGDSVTFDSSYITTQYSIRELTDQYLTNQPWGDLGIDICLGMPMDKKATPFEYMFLPDYVESGFDHAFINEKPLVKEKRIVYESRPEVFRNSFFQPLYLFSIFAFLTIGITLYDFKRNKIAKWFDVILFGGIGAVGLLLFLLWVATDHRAAANNMNLAWALPSHLIVAFALFKKRNWVKKYFVGIMVLNILLLASWAWLPQMLHYTLIPVVLALSIRSFAQYRLS